MKDDRCTDRHVEQKPDIAPAIVAFLGASQCAQRGVECSQPAEVWPAIQGPRLRARRYEGWASRFRGGCDLQIDR